MSPTTTLLLTLAGLSVGLTALLWGLTRIVQGYLYSAPVERLPLRATVGGLALGVFFAGWIFLNTRASHKDKYGVLHEFNPTAVKEVDGFEAVRRSVIKDTAGKPKESTTSYKWLPDAGGRFVDADNKAFRLSDSTSMTIALMLADGEGKKARFEIQLDESGRYPPGDVRRFEEVGGSRYIDVDARSEKPRQLILPSTITLVLALLLNLAHFALWFLVFWPVLRFTTGPALILTVLFGLMSLFIVVPLLFEKNKVPAEFIAKG